MTLNQRHLQFDMPLAMSEVVPQLQKFGFISEGKTTGHQETFLDTFDWRLFGKNTCLVETGRGSRRHLEWLSTESGICLAVAKVQVTPRFVHDLPGGALCDQLKPLLDCRALIPLAQTNTRRRMFKLLNAEEKTVLRLMIEEGTVSPQRKGGPKAAFRRVRLLPVKGYDQFVEKAVLWLERDLGLLPLSEDLAARLFRAAGHKPGGYSSKIEVNLDPAMTAFEAARLLLLTLWQAAAVNEAGVLGDIDSEFLHDFRVAIRRTRSALSQLKGVFPAARVARFQKEFSWLAGVTGPTRDLDVYLLAMPGYEQLILEDFRPSLTALKDLIQRRRLEEFKKLTQVLASPRYRTLKRQWTAFLTNEPKPSRKGGPSRKGETADFPVKALASTRIWRLYRKLLKGGRAITAQSPATDLHELRKLAKKLRYMFELFKSLYPDKDVAGILKVMKLLQQNLGDVQDYEVQADKLTELAAELDTLAAACKETFMAIGMLTAHLMDLQVRARDGFAVVFSDFDQQQMRRAFRKLFKDDNVGGACG